MWVHVQHPGFCFVVIFWLALPIKGKQWHNELGKYSPRRVQHVDDF